MAADPNVNSGACVNRNNNKHAHVVLFDNRSRFSSSTTATAASDGSTSWEPTALWGSGGHAGRLVIRLKKKPPAATGKVAPMADAVVPDSGTITITLTNPPIDVIVPVNYVDDTGAG